MKLNELRIGNFVRIIYSQKPIRVETIDGVGINYEAEFHDAFEEDIEGIPLTPEILEQCGFEKLKSNSCPDYFEFDGLKLWPNNDEETSFYHVNSELLIYIKYLHQLQNLYHSLAGEELQVNIHDKTQKA